MGDIKKYVVPGGLYSQTKTGAKARGISQKIRGEAFEEEVLQPLKDRGKVNEISDKLHRQYVAGAANSDERMSRGRESVDYWLDRTKPKSHKGYGLEKKKK